ncbi:MAG TPA: glucoamylase family protein [bacterium]|nr:glucoamylase family protein [bacterium]
MDNKINFYTLGRDIAIKRKIPSKKFLSVFQLKVTLDYKNLLENISDLYSYLVKEYEKNPEVVPLSASWILDNYYLINQQSTVFSETFKSKILAKLPLSEYDKFYFQIHYIAKKYLEAASYNFSEETLVPFLKGYQKIYPLSSLELWVLPTVIKFELLSSILDRGLEIKEKIENSKLAASIVSDISSDIERGKNPIKRVRRVIKDIEVKPHVLLLVLEDVRELDYRVEDALRLIESKIHEEDLNLEEFTRASVLRDLDLKQNLNNAVGSIRNFSFINWNKFFTKVSIVESTLETDPAGIYPLMDDISRDRYRHVIEDMSANSNFSESEIARKAIESSLASNIDFQKHVGYYLIDKGYFSFAKKIGYRPSPKGLLKDWIRKHPSIAYFGSIILVTFLISVFSFGFFIGITKNLLLAVFFTLIQLFPASNISVYLINKIFTWLLPPALPPKLDFEGSISDQYKTFVAVPCIFSNREQIDILVDNLEKRFLANNFHNLYFALLSDYKDSYEEESQEDKKNLSYLKRKIKQLNLKHKQSGFDVFYVFHRKRVFNPSEGVWMGWERKRGKLMELVSWLSDETHSVKTTFSAIEGDISKLNGIRYVITVDEDTMMPADVSLKLIGAMAHPLNFPVLDEDKKIVTRGYGFIQPRIIISPETENKSPFTKIFVSDSGFDSYSTAISDVYQDTFNRSNFMGKGIFDVRAIKETLLGRFPENSLLSHDLIESCFAKAGFLSDTCLVEDFPTSFRSYISRDNRWVRGDWQLLPWLCRHIPTESGKKVKNPLDALSLWMIFDNLRRSLVAPSFFVLFCLNWIFLASNSISNFALALFFGILLLEIFNIRKYLIHKMPVLEKFLLSANFLMKKIRVSLASFVMIPATAVNKIFSIVKATHRLITRKHLLEWTTHSEVENMKYESNVLEYFLSSGIVYLNATILLILIFLGKATLLNVLILSLWLLSPFFVFYISMSYPPVKLSSKIEDKEKMLSYAKMIWSLFDEYTNEESNFLPPDSVQLSPSRKITYRTSPTNIAFYLLSLNSVYDLGIIGIDEFSLRLENAFYSILKLKKYRGHLYNWYDLKTLEPLKPYVSTADSGNFVASAMLLESSCLEISEKIKNSRPEIAKRLKQIAKNLRKIYLKTDFSFLYSENMSVFSVGYNTVEKQRDTSYYDILASESRITSYVAIALDQVNLKHWFSMSRPVRIRKGKFYLMSWGGTMFEYLLPTLLFNEKDNTFLNQTTREIFKIQKEYADKHNIPWGISESNFDAFDFDSNYQYKMMGVPDLALKRYESQDLVVSPYSSFLALMINPAEAEKNLRRLEEMGAVGPYGFYEAIDFNRSTSEPKTGENVKTYTAHHQGMSLVAINNILNDKIMINRLHDNDYIKSCEILLDEKIPDVANVVEPNQYAFDTKLSNVRRFEKERIRYSNTPNTLFPIAQLYGNGRYLVMISNSGAGYSKFRDIFINRYTEDFTLDNSGHYIFIKDVKNNYFWSATYQPTLVKPDSYEVKFYPEYAEFERSDKETQTTLNIFVPPEKNFEVRELTLLNNSSEVKEYEITTYSEIMLDEYKSGISHPVFNKLFIETKYEDGVLIAERRKRYIRDIEKYAFHFGFSEDSDLTVDSYETARQNFIGRIKHIQNPAALNSALTNSVGTVLDPVFSLRYKIRLEPGESKKIHFIYGYANNLHEIRAARELLFTGEQMHELKYLNNHYVEAKRTHLGIDVRQEILFQKMASRLVYPDYRLRENINIEHNFERNLLYRFSISGENKILAVKINSKNIDLLRNLVLLHEYFRILRFNFDLVFIVDEKVSYEENLEKDVYEVVENSLSRPYEGSGVYVLNSVNMTLEERYALLSLAKVVLDTSLGSLDDQLNLASRYTEPETVAIKESAYEDYIETILPQEGFKEGLDFYNGIGGFSLDGKNYVMDVSSENPTPLPWSNVISNESFGTLVTESGLGYTWNINSQLNKISPWSNDFVSDTQGEILYLKDVDSEKVFTATPLPIKSGGFKVTHSQGYTEYVGKSSDIEHTLTVFVDEHDPVKILKLMLKNTTNYTKTVECSYYVEFVLGEHRYLDQDNLEIEFDSVRQCITAQNRLNNDFSNQIAFMSTNRPIVSATSDRRRFFGRGNSKKTPVWVYNSIRGVTGFKSVSDKCGVLTTEVEIPGNSQIVLTYILGQDDNIDNVNSLVDKYANLELVDQSLKNVIEKWKKVNSVIKVETPDKKLNFLANNWLLYEVLSSRIYGKTAFYQAAGAFGFRDQLQDVMSLVYTDPKIARNHITLCCAHQFKEGDVQHWWHYPSGAGVRTKISDDLLWLPYVVDYYIEKTGDMQILNIEVPYLEMQILQPHEENIYAIPNVSEERGNVLDHCIRAINKSLNFGAHGLPLIGSGDWNDSLNSVGDEGKGESVWLAWFILTILSKFIKILEKTDRKNEAERFSKIYDELKSRVDEHGWDGEWYIRAYYDEGTPLGSHVNSECLIDSISQSWSVISGAAPLEKQQKAMLSHEKYLEDKKNNLVKLLAPPFKDSTPFPGYIQGYPEGIRENGGQYNHGAVWAMKAYAMLKNEKKAYEIFNSLEPIGRSLSNEDAKKYKLEPYAMAGDIYSNPQHLSRGGWSWYTGAAGWLYKVIIEDFLGFKKYADHFSLDPVIPKEWETFSMEYSFENTRYNIKVERGTNKGLYLNDKKIDDGKIPLRENMGEMKVYLVI